MKILNKIPAVFVLTLSIFQTFICQVNAQQNRQADVNPTMKVSNLNKLTENPMRLTILKIDIKIIGKIAVTTLDMTYYNSNSRVMEGEFNFPLGEGQTISRFALDINGELREGVVVEKELGRKTFEAVVRKGIDPGLLEMTKGNNFRMRVYPLPAKGTRRVVLAFEQELTDNGKNDLYLLPLGFDEVVEKFSVHAEVIKGQVSPDTGLNELSNLSFSNWNDSYSANLEQDNYKPNKHIALAFPHISNSERIFTSPKNNNSDSSYFYLTIRPEFSVKPKVLPKLITLLWDNSNSSRGRDIERELAILDAYFLKTGNLSVALVPFNIRTEKAETFIITNGNWDKLKSALKTIVYDGGTSFGSIDFTKYQSDEVLLFSDGITDFGNSEPKFSNTPVYIINSSVSANHDFLTYIAQRSGGVYVNLNKLTDGEALSLLNTNNFHFISAQTESGNVSNIYPSMPCQFTNSFSMSGIMANKTATLLLNFGFGTTVTYTKRIVITTGNPVENALLRRLWAEKKITELNLDVEKNKEQITRTGKEFGIVTENTSLIVLENLSDYLLYKIVPPKEMQEEYFKQIYTAEKDASEKTQSHIEYVVKLSDEQSRWWNTNYPVLPEKSVNKNKSFDNQIQQVDSVTPLADNLSEVVVTGYGTQRRNRLSGAVAGVQVSRSRTETEPAFLMVQEFSDASVSSSRGRQADIQINAWDPQTPYLKVLQYARTGEEYATYLKLKKEYGSTPSFYIDASDFFSKSGNMEIAVRIISNLAELELESPELLRILGNKLLGLNYKGEAVLVFRKVLDLKGEEPQSYRDLGLAYEENGESQQAIRTLYEIVKNNWDNRFPEVEIIAMNEINNIIALHPKLDYSFIDIRLVKMEPVNIRVMLTWDADNCDIDLWVTDPAGEKCFYENKLTRLGGKISDDFTGGYGPEVFMIKKAIQGEYKVQANYYGTHSQSMLAPVNLHLTFITDFGKINQKKQEITIRLENQKDIIDVGKFKF